MYQQYSISDKLIVPKYEAVVTEDAIKIKEDWSKVRSPSRAKRRLKYGHKQNITEYSVPSIYVKDDNLFIHPKKLKEIEIYVNSRLEKQLYAAYASKVPIPERLERIFNIRRGQEQLYINAIYGALNDTKC